MFGGLAAECDGRRIERFQTKQTASLFAYLVLNPGRYVPREILCDMLWPSSRPDAARASLNQAISWIRREFGDETLLQTDRRTVALAYDRVSTDVAEFLDLIDLDSEDRSERLERALALYSADLLEGNGDGWVRVERVMLAEKHILALRELCDLSEAKGDFESAIRWLREVIRAEPLEEAHHIRLVQLYGRAHQRGAIRRHFTEYEQLTAGAGRSPTFQFRSLVEGLLREDEPEDPLVLPHLVTRFFGREGEIETICDLIHDGARLVTLLGFSGVGKTRLSLEVAHRLRESFETVLFVPLADLQRGDEVAAAILRQMEVDFNPATPALGRLALKLAHAPRMLIVLDNFDSLVESGGRVVKELLSRSPNVFFLTTSQAKLALIGETVVSIGSLPVPAPDADLAELEQNPSCQMFVDRARLAHPDFRATEENASVLAALCHRLEGLPLAIELAAPWTQPHSLHETLRDLTDRFDLLVNEDASDRPERHRSLKASFEYSFRLLPEDLQSILVRLCVFEGGWSKEAAAAVLGESDLRGPLKQLIDRSLVVSEAKASPPRFLMLDSLREFGAERLSDQEKLALGEQHARYFRGLVTEAFSESNGPKRPAWVVRLREDLPNVMAALQWYEDHGHACALEMAARLGWFWQIHGPLDEARTRMALLLARFSEHVETEIALDAYLGLGNLELLGASLEGAEKAFSAALQVLDGEDLDRKAAIWAGLSGVALRRNELPKAQELLELSIDVAEQIGDLVGSSRGHLYLAFVLSDMGDYEAAKTHFDRSLAIEAEREDVAGIARVYSNLGHWARFQSRLPLAKHYAEESHRIYRSIGQKPGIARAKLNLAQVLVRQDEVVEALPLLNEAIRLFDEFGDPLGVQSCIAQVTMASAALDRYPDAARLMAIESAFAEQLKAPMSPQDAEIYQQTCETIRARLSPDDLAAIETDVLSMSGPQKVRTVLEILAPAGVSA